MVIVKLNNKISKKWLLNQNFIINIAKNLQKNHLKSYSAKKNHYVKNKINKRENKFQKNRKIMALFYFGIKNCHKIFDNFDIFQILTIFDC